MVPLNKVIILSILINDCFCQEDTLQLVIVIFRHGHRTNDKITVYPKDPYLNYNYYPYGYGQLTDEGKQRMYSLGKKLRERYKHFLDLTYSPDVLYATSTKIMRAKESLSMVLYGLFPSETTPNRFTFDEEITHLPSFAYCRKYQKLYQNYINSESGQKITGTYSKWYPYLSYHTGVNVKSLLNVLFLYYHLQIQIENGMKIPLWTFPVFPHVLRNGTLHLFNTLTATKELRTLSAGKLIKTVINVMKEKVNGTLSPGSRKMLLYSGHDTNILSALTSLNADFDHIPPYGACVLLELHKKEDQYFTKIFYEDYTSYELKQLTSRGCSKECPFHQLLELINDYLTVDDSICNYRKTTHDPFDIQ